MTPEQQAREMLERMNIDDAYYLPNVDELAKLIESHTWQPIETAPKDGRKILIFDPRLCKEDQVEMVFWDGTIWSIDWRDGAPNPYEYEPFCWMPLPEPPPRILGFYVQDGGFDREHSHINLNAIREMNIQEEKS